RQENLWGERTDSVAGDSPLERARAGARAREGRPGSWRDRDAAAFSGPRPENTAAWSGSPRAMGPPRRRRPPNSPRPLTLLRLQQAGLQREPHQLGAVLEAELLHDAGAVGVDRLRADEELLADLGGAVALGGEGGNLPFPVREPIEGTRLLPSLRLAEALEQQFGGARVEEDLAPGNGAHGLDELRVRAGLGDVAAAAGLEDGEQVLLLRVDGEDEDAAVLFEPGDAAGRFEAAHSRHREVHDD